MLSNDIWIQFHGSQKPNLAILICLAPSDYTIGSVEPVTNRSWPRIRIVHIFARSFKNLQREHRKRTLDADNVYAEGKLPNEEGNDLYNRAM